MCPCVGFKEKGWPQKNESSSTTKFNTVAERTLVYVCGPASMIDDVERIYTKEGGRPPLRKEQVLFERWW